VSLDDLMMRARQGTGPLRFLKPTYKAIMGLRLPMIRPFWGTVHALTRFLSITWGLFTKFIYREPMFRYRCASVGRRLQLEGAVPQIIGNGRIVVGDDFRVGTRNTWVVGFKVSEGAELTIGNRVSINYQTVISVAKRVTIGDHVMIAGNAQIFDNISHPLSPARRLRYESFTLDEAAPVTIGNNVWIGGGAIIMRGVTIGENSVIAAGSIVTRDVPPNTLVGGNPARILRDIADDPTHAG